MLEKKDIILNRISLVIRIILLSISIAIACIPLINKALPGGYMPDLGYNMIRIEGVKEAIMNHTYPTRVYSFAMGGYGYAGSMYYQDYYFIIPAIARILGLGIKESYRMFIVIIQICICFSSYYSVKYISKSTTAATISAIMMQLSQFYLADLYDRSGLSESLSLVFIPILLVGLYSLFEDGERIYCIGIGLVGIMMSHSIPFFFGVVLTVSCLIICIPRYIKNISLLWRVLRVGFFSILISAFVYIPLMEQLLKGENNLSKQWFRIGEMGEPVKSFFRLYGYYYVVAYIGIGVPVLICLAIRILMLFRHRKYGWADRFIILGMLILISTTDIVPWKIFEDKFLGMIQFPYRLYIYAFPILMMGCGMMMAQILEEFKIPPIINRVSVFLFILIIYVFGIRQVISINHAEETENIEADYFNHVENTVNVGMGEWLPRGAELRGIPEENVDIITVNGGSISDYRRGYNSVEFNVDSSNDTYMVPLIYYLGYKAELITETGETFNLPLGISNDNRNRLQVINDSNQSGIIRVEYAGTGLQRISVVISALGIILCAAYIMLRKN